MSLGRPFLAAGASAVIGALWPVDDARNPAFMQGIHKEMASGLSAAQAVASAQRRAKHAGVPVAVWAAYVVMSGTGGRDN
jgi:CHAT domain-containing protein